MIKDKDKDFKYILLYTYSYEEDNHYTDTYREFYSFSDLMNYLMNEIPRYADLKNIKIYEINKVDFNKFDKQNG